jgi:hypothetical protein
MNYGSRDCQTKYRGFAILRPIFLKKCWVSDVTRAQANIGYCEIFTLKHYLVFLFILLLDYMEITSDISESFKKKIQCPLSIRDS